MLVYLSIIASLIDRVNRFMAGFYVILLRDCLCSLIVIVDYPHIIVYIKSFRKFYLYLIKMNALL